MRIGHSICIIMVPIRCPICSLLEEFNVHMECPICMECLMPTCSVQIPHRVSNMLPMSNLRMEYPIYTCSVRCPLVPVRCPLVSSYTCSIQYAVNLKGPVFTSRIKCSMSMVPLNLGQVQLGPPSLGPLILGPFISAHLTSAHSSRPTNIRFYLVTASFKCRPGYNDQKSIVLSRYTKFHYVHIENPMCCPHEVSSIHMAYTIYCTP